MTYPAKFRKQAFHVEEKEDLTQVETAKRLGVGVASIARWKTKPEFAASSLVSPSFSFTESNFFLNCAGYATSTPK